MNEACFSGALVMTAFLVCPCHGSHGNILYADAVQVRFMLCLGKEYFV